MMDLLNYVKASVNLTRLIFTKALNIKYALMDCYLLDIHWLSKDF